MIHSRPSIDDLPVALFTYSVDSARFTSVNAKLAKTLGYGPGEILALRPVTDIIPEDQRDQVREMIRRREAGGDREVRYTTDDSVATGLRWSVDAAGMEAHVVATGAEVLPAIETFRPDVVVLDLSLPDEDGRTVYERIAAQSAVPVVLSSGHVSDAELPELLGLPRTRFFMKPYPADALVNAIRELVEVRCE